MNFICYFKRWAEVQTVHINVVQTCVTLSECDVKSMRHSTEMNYYFIYTAWLVTKIQNPSFDLFHGQWCLYSIVVPWHSTHEKINI